MQAVYVSGGQMSTARWSECFYSQFAAPALAAMGATLLKQYTTALSSIQPRNQAAAPALAAREATLLKQYTTAPAPAFITNPTRKSSCSSCPCYKGSNTAQAVYHSSNTSFYHPSNLAIKVQLLFLLGD
jgi:hypothetical protein